MMIAELVKQAKGVSSHFINQENLINDHFKWEIGMERLLLVDGIWIR